VRLPELFADGDAIGMVFAINNSFDEVGEAVR
jgi:hypothetical protein